MVVHSSLAIADLFSYVENPLHSSLSEAQNSTDFRQPREVCPRVTPRGVQSLP